VNERPLTEFLDMLAERERLDRELRSPQTKKDFGAYVAAGRQAVGMTQSDLATALGVSRNYVAQIENGHKTPTQGTVTAFTDVLWSAAAQEGGTIRAENRTKSGKGRARGRR
jgi:ribosome-binding protein aMBF1 (putative translation factor)